MVGEMSFPDGFLWGLATSAYQIEGAVREDGRGESIWDRFSHTPSRIENDENGDVACDHYHRWAEDVDLLARMRVPAYRFSVAWPRIQPEGKGRPEPRGLAFYERLVDRLLQRGIVPVVTLYHWDLPQALQDRGGWPARETAMRFVDYAELVYRSLGDRIPWWITHNEPWVAAWLGHVTGDHAPGMTDLGASLRAGHHLLLSHGLAVEAYRALGLPGRIGITLNLAPVYPETDSEADHEAALVCHASLNRWYLDPLFRGGYPEETSALYEGLTGPLEAVQPGDLERIAAPIDFLGVNYYFPVRVEAGSGQGLPWRWLEAPRPGIPTTEMGWEVVPEALTDLLVSLRRDYGERPLLITENGAAYAEAPGPDGEVQDEQRIDYFRGHLAAALEAIRQGVDLRGYLAWSFLDNFEWAKGYRPRFGVVYVDFPTQRRIPKASARFLGRVFEANGLPDP
jgi:beta-glucosidase